MKHLKIILALVTFCVAVILFLGEPTDETNVIFSWLVMKAAAAALFALFWYLIKDYTHEIEE